MSSVAPASPELHVNALSKRHHEFWALRDASFVIHSGEILGLIGPNGSGKTTLFECIAGLRTPTGGSVAVHGIAIPAHKRKEYLYLVPDGIHPWADQTVGWVLRHSAGMHGRSAARRARVASSLALEPLLQSRLGELSKGEHRRVTLAMGLLSRQPLLLLDEPFDGLDLRQTRDVMRVLREHVAEGRTLFLSVHQLNDAARICDRLLLLSAGNIVGTGTVAELQALAGVENGGLEEIFLALT